MAAVDTARWSRAAEGPPTRASHLIERPTLVAELERIISREPVTVVAAPSGWGKTVALVEWATLSPLEVAWLTVAPLDEESVDLALVSAVEQSSLRSGPATRDRIELALAQRTSPLVIVLDDAQHAEASIRSGLLAGLLAQPLPGLHLVFAGTAALELTAGLTPDVDAGRLAFAVEEIEALASGVGSAVDAKALHHETGGWPVAVRLLLSAEANRQDARARRTNELMHEYVRDVVLADLDRDLAAFVLDATICDEVTPRLAGVVTEQVHAATQLERCRRLGLAERVDAGAGTPVYRWRPLIARQCREVLAEQRPGRSAVLRRRAATALRESRPLEAAAHFLAVGDAEAAARVIQDSWLWLLLTGSADAVERLGVALPTSVASGPALQLIRACAREVMGERRAARELFETAEAAASTDPSYRRQRELALLLLVDGREELAEAAAPARMQLHDDRRSPREQAAIALLIAWTEARVGASIDALLTALAVAERKAEVVGDEEIPRMAHELRVYALAWAGRLTEARVQLASLSAEASGSWERYVGPTRDVAEGLVAHLSGDLPAARRAFRRAISAGPNRAPFTNLARVLLVATAAASGDLRQCRRAALHLRFVPRVEVQGIAWPALRQAMLGSMELAAGEFARAVPLAQAGTEAPLTPIAAVAVAGVLRRTGRLDEALGALASTTGPDVAAVRVETRLTMAVRELRQERADAAHALLDRALAVAAPERMSLPFTTAEPRLRELMERHLDRGGLHVEFLRGCLGAQPEEAAARGLSRREQEVLGYLRTHLTTTEIASRLGLSHNTVKTHQSHIYRKLGVTSRREAMRSA
ncbi:LuxR C-terminal-related transcriptional regulator [Microbacterium sp. AZCO]|uniref:LuxR C-terminal-related transcriptional regulator n=1 Tax=Microbacterium sp. AZCO TaxID=3142976 RepID=UPI0031F3D989